jgi:hypothetical protein
MNLIVLNNPAYLRCKSSIVVSGLELFPLNAGRRRAKQHDSVAATEVGAPYVH